MGAQEGTLLQHAAGQPDQGGAGDGTQRRHWAQSCQEGGSRGCQGGPPVLGGWLRRGVCEVSPPQEAPHWDPQHPEPAPRGQEYGGGQGRGRGGESPSAQDKTESKR